MTTDTLAPTETEPMETVEAFRLRARAWIKANLGPLRRADIVYAFEDDAEQLAAVTRDRALQRQLYDGGFAGICFPRAYGGQGLTAAHQLAFNEEMEGHEYPTRLMCPTFTPCGTLLLQFGTDEQKARRLPPMLKGEELWCQMLSEPGGGSDAAGAITSAVRDGDDWILNGSKVWTSSAWFSQWALVLARTDWNVPKHQGLTVFMAPLDIPGMEIRRIERLDGNTEFCQEFLTDVRIPDSYRLGEINDGWTVGTAWMAYERRLASSPYTTIPVGAPRGEPERSLVATAREAGRLDDPRVVDLLGESRMLDVVRQQFSKRLATADWSNPNSGAVGRLFGGVSAVRQATIAFEIAGDAGAIWADDEAVAGLGLRFLLRQTRTIGGGTSEMARNVIAERLLDMPKEAAADRNIPFRDVPRGPR